MSENVQLGVSTVMAGEILPTLDGGETIAMVDAVVLIPSIDGVPRGNYTMTPEQAMAIASAIASAAGHLINQEVDDHGKPTTLRHRLSRLAPGTGN